MPLHHFRGHQHRRFLARNHRRGDHHVAFRHHFPQQLPLPLVERFILRPRVAARVLRVLGLDRQLDESPAQALHLFLRRRPHVVRRSHRAQPPRRGDRLQPATPAPITSTRAGVIVPAAVVSIGKIRGSVSAAISTAL